MVQKLTIDNLTVWKAARSLAPANRVKMAQDPRGNHWLSLLTPAQYAELFPSYYKKQLPDIGKSVSGGVPMSGGGGSSYSSASRLSTSAGPRGSPSSGKTYSSGSSGTKEKPDNRPVWQKNMEKAYNEKVATKNVASGTTPGGLKTLASQRQAFANELKDPNLKKRLFDIMANEQGKHAQGTLAIIESAMNRAYLQGTTLKQQLRWKADGGYYQGREGKVRHDPNNPIYQQNLDNALGGSNISNFATDNSSGKWGEVRIGFYGHTQMYQYPDPDKENKLGGEQFTVPGTTGNFSRKKWQNWVEEVKSTESSMSSGQDEGKKGGLTNESFWPENTTPTPEQRQQTFAQGGIIVNLDTNSGPKGKQIGPLIIIPDNATYEQRKAAEAYVSRIEEAYKEKFGKSLKGSVRTRAENGGYGHGRDGTMHTEPFAVTDTKAVEYFSKDPLGRSRLAEITASTLGTIPGVKFSLPHDPNDNTNIGRTDHSAHGSGTNEVELAGILLGDLRSKVQSEDPIIERPTATSSKEVGDPSQTNQIMPQPSLRPSADPALHEGIRKYMDGLPNTSEGQEQKRQLQQRIDELGIDKVNSIFEQSKSSESSGGIPNILSTPENAKKFPAGEERFFYEGGKVENGNIKLNDKLVNVLKAASKDLPEGYHARMFSGVNARKRGTKNHPGGVAVDLKIVDGEGKELPDRGFGEGHKIYEQLAQSMRIRGKEMYPETDYIWGGAWTAAGGDRMHYQISDPEQRVLGASGGSGAYSFEKGINRGGFWAGKNAADQFMTDEELKSYQDSVRANIEAESQNSNSQSTATPLSERGITSHAKRMNGGGTGESTGQIILERDGAAPLTVDTGPSATPSPSVSPAMPEPSLRPSSPPPASPAPEAKPAPAPQSQAPTPAPAPQASVSQPKNPELAADMSSHRAAPASHDRAMKRATLGGQEHFNPSPAHDHA